MLSVCFLQKMTVRVSQQALDILQNKEENLESKCEEGGSRAWELGIMPILEND